MTIALLDIDHDLDARRKLYALFDSHWPRLSDRIALAERAGADPWHRISAPFVAYDDGRIVAHVGVLAIPFMLAGARVTIGGIHAVVTHPAYRRRGYVRELLQEALAYCDSRFASVQLTTGVPDVFRRSGFRAIPQTCFEVSAARRRRPAFRPLTIDSSDDRMLLARLLRGRQPVSYMLASLDPGWLFLTDEVLATGGLTRLHYATDLDVVAAYEVKDERLCLYDVVGERLPALGELLEGIPAPHACVDLFFTPDRFDVKILAEREAYPDDNIMVRGPYPVEGRPVVLPLLAHC
jgi:GNAT superfamily N-acetyltransferase